MQKWNKNRIFKKYSDEVWGSIINKNKYNYTKKLILLNYKHYLKRKRFKIKSNYRYFKFSKLLSLSKLKYLISLNSKNFKQTLKGFNYTYINNYLPMLNLTSSVNNIFYLNFFKNEEGLFRIAEDFINYSHIKKRLEKDLIILFSKNKYNKNLLFSVPLLDKSICSVNTNYLLIKNKYFNSNSSFLFKDCYKYFYLYRFGKANSILKRKLTIKQHKQFFYSVHIASPQKRKKKWSLFGSKMIYYRKICLFYSFNRPKDFFKLYNRIKKIKDQMLVSFILLLETRLEIILKRLNFFTSPYFIKRFLLAGNVYINNLPIRQLSSRLGFGKVFSIKKNKFFEVYSSLKMNLANNKVFINNPKFLEVDYKLLTAILINKPALKDLTYPLSFDLYTKFLSISR